MKKVLFTLIAVIFCAGLVACGNVSNDDKVESTTTKVETGTEASTEALTPFEQFETGLEELGMEYTKTTTAAEMVGGKQGARYEANGSEVELYIFEDGEAFEKVKKNKAVTIDGFGDTPVIINDHLVLMINEKGDKEKEITELFESIK